MAAVHPKTDMLLQRFGCHAWPLEDVRFWDEATSTAFARKADMRARSSCHDGQLDAARALHLHEEHVGKGLELLTLCANT
jgi:hypothetical protein